MTDMTAVSSAAPPDNPIEAFSAGPWPTVRKTLEVVGWLIVAGLIFVGLTSLIGRTLSITGAYSTPNLVPEEYFNTFDIRYYQQTVATILHLLPGFLIVILGPLQFIPLIRKRWINLHRWSGRVFIVCGATGAVSGFLIGGLDPFGGFNGPGFDEAMATWFFSSYILFCLYKAYSSVRQKQFGAHREWMIRSFALMIAIATERIMFGVLQATTNISFEVLFGATFWMAGMIHIVASETWIQLTRTPGNGARHWKDLDAKAAAAS